MSDYPILCMYVNLDKVTLSCGKKKLSRCFRELVDMRIKSKFQNLDWGFLRKSEITQWCWLRELIHEQTGCENINTHTYTLPPRPWYIITRWNKSDPEATIVQLKFTGATLCVKSCWYTLNILKCAILCDDQIFTNDWIKGQLNWEANHVITIEWQFIVIYWFYYYSSFFPSCSLNSFSHHSDL